MRWLTVSALAAPAIIRDAAAAEVSPALQAAVDAFSKLPGTASCLVVAGYPEVRWQAAYNPAAHLFISGAFKTFVLAQFLRDVEAGRLSEDTQETIDDACARKASPCSSTSPARPLHAAFLRL